MEDKSETITIKKHTLWMYSTFVLAALVVILLVIIILPNEGFTGNVVAPTAQAGQVEQAQIDLRSEDHYIKGNENSKVVIVEYSDFECPFCARAHSDAMAQIKSSYSDSEVGITYRHFPLSFHPQAQKAAEASECAAEQGKFKEMHDMLFEQGVAGGVTTFKQYASTLGLDTSKFNSCLDSGKYASVVQKDFTLGQNQGVQGTPGFFVGNEADGFTVVSGAQPFANFKTAIDSYL